MNDDQEFVRREVLGEGSGPACAEAADALARRHVFYEILRSAVAVDATLDAKCLPPVETIRSAKLKEATDSLRELRREVECGWFDMTLERRARARAWVIRVESAIARPNLVVIARAIGRYAWHAVVDFQSYFPARDAYVAEVVRLVDAIKAKAEQEDSMHRQLFAESDVEAIRAGPGYAELRAGTLIPGTIEDLEQRREARRSRATG